MKHRSAATASKIIEFAIRGRDFMISDIQSETDNSPSRQTVYRICSQLQEDGWIEQRGNGWHPSVKARMIGSVDGDRDGNGDADDANAGNGNDEHSEGFSLDLDEIL